MTAMHDETLERWLDRQIEFAENERGLLRSYRQDVGPIQMRLAALRDVRMKMIELGWPANGQGTTEK